VKAQEIADYLKLELVGNPNKDVSSVAHIEEANEHQLAYWSGDWSSDSKSKYDVSSNKAGIIIGRETSADALQMLENWSDLAALTYIISEQPRYDFEPQISKSAVIHPTATLNIEGMNYSRGKNGDLQKVPHVGGLIIGDNVEVGALTTIQKGVLKDTVIGKGSKIGPKCNIGHGAHIGEHCLITGMNFIGGSAVLGNRVYVAPHSTIKNGVKVGDDAFIGIGSLVLRDVPSGATVVGRPAVHLEQFRSERERLKCLLQNQREVK